MPRILTALVDCGTCGTTYEGAWPDDSIDEQDRAEAPEAEQTCPAGHKETLEYPGVELEKRGRMISNELMEKLEGEYARQQGCMWNSIVRNGWDTPAELERLGWYDLYDLPNIGPKRILSLVNFIRENGGELPWFAKWDEDADKWQLLGDSYRVPAVQPL